MAIVWSLYWSVYNVHCIMVFAMNRMIDLLYGNTQLQVYHSMLCISQLTMCSQYYNYYYVQ
jgi:hypothetical protein